MSAAIELHKVASDTTLAVAFVGRDTVALLRENTRSPGVSIRLYTRRWRDAQDIVGLPIQNIDTTIQWRFVQDDERLPRTYVVEVKLR